MFRKTTVALLIVLFVLLACGKAGTNNDQGVIFQSTGYYADTAGATGSTGTVEELFSNDSDFGGLGAFNGRIVTAIIGLRNNLGAQFLNLTRIDCNYGVAGSSLSVPSDSFTVGGLIPKGGSDLFVEFPILSPDIISFLNVNKNSLPELPFRLTASCAGVAISEAGDTLVTNRSPYSILFVEQAAVSTNPGTGGAIDSSGDNDSEPTTVDSGGA